MIRRDRLAIAGGAVALVGAVLLALPLAWGRVVVGWSSFGFDLQAYEAAADRLAKTGSPYADELRAGPIANDADNVFIGYFYPPPLAQAFEVVRGVDHGLLTTIWTGSQAVLAFVLLPLVWRRSGGTPGLAPLLWLAALAIGSHPFQYALVIGNVSGWSALLVAAALIAAPRAQGLVAGGLSLLKPTNAPIFLAALVERRSRVPALVLVLGVGVISLALSPTAWWAWLEVLPNILRLPPGGSPESVSLASMLRDTPAGALAAQTGTVLGLTCLALGLWLTHREGLSRRVVSAAVASSLLLNPTLWDHYLAVMVPIAIAAWPNVSDRWRPLLVLGGVTHLVGWVGDLGVLRAIVLFGGFVATTVASIGGDAPERRDRLPVETGQGSSSG